MGSKCAAVIAAHTVVVNLWYMLTRQQAYVDRGMEYFDQRDHERVARQAIKRLEVLGYHVTLNPASGAAFGPRTRLKGPDLSERSPLRVSRENFLEQGVL